MVRINLLPIRENLRKRELKHFAMLALAIFVGSIVLMVLTYVFFTTKVNSLKAERETHQKELNVLKEKNKEIEELKARITRLQKQVDTIKKLTETRDTPAPFMSAVSLAMPQEVWVNSIVKNGKHFTLDGIGLDNTVVVKFVQQMARIRSDFTLNNLFIKDDVSEGDKTFFADVRLVQLVSAAGTSAAAGQGAMSFKIVGNLR
jgi:type IV pilus assembly protein PilN